MSHAKAEGVAEMQGLYGPFTFPERLLQKIWHQGAFDRGAAVTQDGRAVKIVHAGDWNRLAGPDFKGARLVIDGKQVRGDVELHLRAGDWRAHRHADDPAYAGVVLHVVLFPPGPDETLTAGAAGNPIPVLALLPLLHHDLESYAVDDAMESLAGRPVSQLGDLLAALRGGDWRTAVTEHAERRWRHKVRAAGMLLQKAGWEAACHRMALEVLGYRFNREPMIGAASRLPLDAWRREGAECVATALACGSWARRGVRPANHPRARLEQYARWVGTSPDWPQAAQQLAADVREAAEASEGCKVGVARRRGKLASLRELLLSEVCGGALGGSRADTFICDGLFPLLAADEGEGGGDVLRAVWHAWYPGDQPDAVKAFWRDADRGGRDGGAASPIGHGDHQGVLGWLVAQRES